MRFSAKKLYSATVFDKDANYVFNAFNLHFESKAKVLRWAAYIANHEQKSFGHVAVCDDETSEIVRYTPSGRIWG